MSSSPDSPGSPGRCNFSPAELEHFITLCGPGDKARLRRLLEIDGTGDKSVGRTLRVEKRNECRTPPWKATSPRLTRGLLAVHTNEEQLTTPPASILSPAVIKKIAVDEEADEQLTHYPRRRVRIKSAVNDDDGRDGNGDEKRRRAADDDESDADSADESYRRRGGKATQRRRRRTGAQRPAPRTPPSNNRRRRHGKADSTRVTRSSSRVSGGQAKRERNVRDLHAYHKRRSWCAGARIATTLKRKRRVCPATIIRVRRNGTYDVRFDVGDVVQFVRPEALKHISEARSKSEVEATESVRRQMRMYHSLLVLPLLTCVALRCVPPAGIEF